MSNSPILKVFILWAKNFDEVATTIFAAQMRQRGVTTKLVAITPNVLRGYHGVSIVPDQTLEQLLATASQASHLIIPVTQHGAHYLLNDPRFTEFCRLVASNKGRFLFSQGSEPLLEKLSEIPEAQVDWYPSDEDLYHFAQSFAQDLEAINRSLMNRPLS